MMQWRVLILTAVVVGGDCGGSAARSPDAGSSVSDARAVLPDSGASKPDMGSTSSDGSPAGVSDSGASPSDAPGAGAAGTLAARYPCDQGMQADPAVVWMENFEEGSVAAVTGRYNSAADPPGMQLLADVPTKSCGKASMQMTSSPTANATDLYKQLPQAEEWFVRWYAKYQSYQAGLQWHHTGVWFGGYNPPTPWPNPQAGLLPSGNDRFSVAIEPAWGAGAPNQRLDFYNYWMQMHSWMEQPSGNTAYYGNSLVHKNAFTADDSTWICVEVHVKLNTDPASSAGGVLEVWRNDVLMQHFDSQAPTGCWIRDKFCLPSDDGSECTDYPSLCLQPYLPLDLQWRSTTALQLNYFWPQNYITDGIAGNVQYDDMVVATTRIGCLQ